jgi:hypothetical protein
LTRVRYYHCGVPQNVLKIFISLQDGRHNDHVVLSTELSRRSSKLVKT